MAEDGSSNTGIVWMDAPSAWAPHMAPAAFKQKFELSQKSFATRIERDGGAETFVVEKGCAALAA